MTTIALSTLKMAQSYANRLGLQYDHKEYPFGGGHFTCYDDAGQPIYTIKYHGTPLEVIDRKQVYEIYCPHNNRYEQYFTREALLEEFDFEMLQIPYVSQITTYHDGQQVVTRVIMDDIIDTKLPFSGDLVNLLHS